MLPGRFIGHISNDRSGHAFADRRSRLGTRCRPGRAVTESVAPQLSWSAKEEDENEAAVGISPDRCGGRFGVERIPSAGFALRGRCIPCKLLCLGSMLSAGGPLPCL